MKQQLQKTFWSNALHSDSDSCWNVAIVWTGCTGGPTCSLITRAPYVQWTLFTLKTKCWSTWVKKLIAFAWPVTTERICVWKVPCLVHHTCGNPWSTHTEHTQQVHLGLNNIVACQAHPVPMFIHVLVITHSPPYHSQAQCHTQAIVCDLVPLRGLKHPSVASLETQSSIAGDPTPLALYLYNCIQFIHW